MTISLPSSAKPDFLVIGAGRSGTTSLHQYLSQHPQLFLPPKNPSYFYATDLTGSPLADRPAVMPHYFVTSGDAYSRLFCDAPSGCLRGEVSPVYLASTRVASRIARVLPGIRLIAILRHPIDRVRSRYLSRHRDGLESAATFEQLVDRELDKPVHRDDAHATYLAGGMTSHFLATYLDLFPRENILILFFEDFARDTATSMADICRFLDIDNTFPFDVSHIYNQGGGRIRNHAIARLWAGSEPWRRRLRPCLPKRWRDKAFQRVTARSEPVPLMRDTRRRLLDFYGQDIERLQELTGRDLSHWRC
ncbi:MAG: sulfotransferase [Cyanobacteria bacterium]|nr:sulfotransferase [Cyanobacteriota bacterium]